MMELAQMKKLIAHGFSERDHPRLIFTIWAMSPTLRQVARNFELSYGERDGLTAELISPHKDSECEKRKAASPNSTKAFKGNMLALNTALMA